MLAKSITSIPLQNVNDYTYELVSPAPGFTIDVASQLYIIMCQDLNFGPPCDGGYVAPGLCCKLKDSELFEEAMLILLRRWHPSLRCHFRATQPGRLRLHAVRKHPVRYHGTSCVGRGVPGHHESRERWTQRQDQELHLLLGRMQGARRLVVQHNERNREGA